MNRAVPGEELWFTDNQRDWLSEDYLLKAMREYQSGARIGYGRTMLDELKGLSEADLHDLAHLFAHLPGP